MRAGFAEIDITPPIGTHKIGWLRLIVSDSVLDPLMARAAIFESGDARLGFIQLDTLFIEAADVADIRGRIQSRFGFPGANIMVAATHNHAGPAIADCGEVRRDEAYMRSMIEKIVAVFGLAMGALRPAEVGQASVFEHDLSYNRRIAMRDGTTKCQHTFDDPNALCVEGPIDPEVAVLAARTPGGGEWLGAMVNFACHPTHWGGETALSAGYPGALAAEMKARGFPVTLFLNGASGNLIFFDSRRSNQGHTMEEMGRVLAEDACRAVGKMAFAADLPLRAASRMVAAPWRDPTAEDLSGTALGAQRYSTDAIYSQMIDRVRAERQDRATCDVEVQVLSVGDRDYAAIPGEYFVQNGLRIKQGAWPRHALVASNANGSMFYLPHKEAFARGGYETTFPGTKFAPGTAELLADAAVALTHNV